MSSSSAYRTPRGPLVTGVVFAATVAQLAVATFATGLPQFSGKGFGARLVAYPLLMLLVPALWLLAQRVRRGRGLGASSSPPWTAFALVMTPFLVDVTGNSLNLYDTVAWWDDANHFVNWIFLCTGIGLIVCRSLEPLWAVVVVVAGLGALLAVAWELGEWFAFIRHGTELDTAYEDTLGDEALGTLGGFVAAALVARRVRRARTRGRSSGDPARPGGRAAAGG